MAGSVARAADAPPALAALSACVQEILGYSSCS
jgi:hypothetical protein